MEKFLQTAVLFLDISLIFAASKAEWDPNGYIIYCPCMGRFGNQADHFLGALSFAKAVNRTLVLPPWRTYKNIPFDEWFQIHPIAEYHRVILAEEFMIVLAPKYWPPGNRSGWCYHFSNTPKECAMKEGNPFGPFWDGLSVDFDSYVYYAISYRETEEWKTRFPPDKYPVYAFKGAPAHFPVEEHDVHLHKYLQWSTRIEEEAQHYIDKNFKGQPFIGIHLRNGQDWVNVCTGEYSAVGTKSYMSSPQCLGYHSQKEITKNMCLPEEPHVLRVLKNLVIKTRVKLIYIATDQNPMKAKIEKHLKSQKVSVFHYDPWLPQIDLAILGKADYFIGNCISSFTAFVKRERDVVGKPSYFWGVS